MKTITTLLIALTILCAQAGCVSPADALSSPVQATRDRAAAEVRSTFRATAISKWTPVMAKITKGQKKTEILELLRPFNVVKELEVGSGQSHSQSYRLDNEWVLTCWFENAGGILIDRKLDQSMQNVWTPPPEKFTGVWVVYFVNGQKSHEIHYREGQYAGELIAYHSDGSRSVVQHYTADGVDGEDTGYYPSGKIAYRAQYRAGKPVGTWTWHDAFMIRNGFELKPAK